MKSNRKLLSILLVFLMMVSTLGNLSSAFAETEIGQAVSETTGTELQGEVIGDKEVFDFTMPERAEGQAEEALSSRSADVMRPLGAPVALGDTMVTVKTKGLNGTDFDWTSLPNDEFQLIARWETTDGQKHEKRLSPAITEKGVYTYDVGWPTDGTMQGNASLVTDFNQNIDIRVLDTTGTSESQPGRLSFTIVLTELAESRAKVEYLDPYGRPLEGNDLPSADNVPQVTADELTDVAIDLPRTSGQINMRDGNNIDEDELNTAEYGLTYKVGGKVDEDKIKIGEKEYTLDISQPSATQIATIKLIYKKDVIIPPIDNEGNPPSSAADGYVRVTFDPTNEATNSTKTYYDVKETLTWKQARETTSTPRLAEPQAPTASDPNKNFIAWKDGDGQTLADKRDDATVEGTTFTAKFGADIIPFDPSNPNDPDKDKPDNDAYATVTLDANGGSFARGTKTAFHVRKTYTVNASDFDTAKAALTPKANTVFKEWAEKNGNDYISFPAAGKTYGSDATVYATYRGNKDIIPFDPKNSNDPDKNNPDPNDYVTVRLDQNGGEFESGTKSAFHVKKTYNVTVGDFKKALDKLHPPENQAFKEWAEKDSNGAFTPFQKSGKKYSADGVVYATYRDDRPIIPYDPQNPNDPNKDKPSPDYVNVIFDATSEGQFEQGTQKKYFWVKTGVATRAVKDELNQDPTFKDTNVKKVFDKWMDNGAVASFNDEAVGENDKMYKATYRDDADIVPIPDPNNPTPKPSGDYVKVSFDATDDGQFEQNVQKKDFWVKKTVTTASVKGKLGDNPTFKDAQAHKVFDKWMDNNAVASFNDEAVGENDKMYKATYRDDADIVPIPDPNNPTPKPSGDYVKVSFDATDDGQFEQNVQKKDFWVKKTVTTASVKGKLGDNPTFKDAQAHKVFDKWMDNNAVASFNDEAVGNKDRTYLATYKGERDIIPFDPMNPKDPDKDKPNDSYVTVKLNANGGSFATGTKSAFHVKKTYTVKVSDFKAAQDALTAPSGQAFKEWAEKEGNVFKTFPVAGKTYQKDGTVYAIYKNAGGGGSSGGGPAPTPTPEKKEKSESKLNVVDHYAYMVGYPDKTFRANTQMTRAEVTMMFARLLKDRPVGTPFTPNRYRDVIASNWYAYAVDYMSEQNIVSGYPDGTFRPNAPITRAEFAAMAARFDKLKDAGNSTFTDVSAKHWASKVIAQAASKDWVSGYPDGTFKPSQNITRVEVVSATNRILNRYADLAFAKAHKSELAPMVDIEESHWGYGAIVEAMNGHDYVRQADGKTEKWERLNGKAFTFPTPLAS